MAVSSTTLNTTAQSISAINAVLATENATSASLVTQKAEVDTSVTSISAVSSKLAALSSAADVLSSPSGVFGWSATSTDPAVVAVANGTPSSPSFAVSVSSLASAQVQVSSARGSATDRMDTAGVLSINMGGTSTHVTVSASDSMADIAANINASGARVSASVLYDSSSDSYRLAIQGLDAGAANAFTISETGEGRQAGTHSISSLGITRASNATQLASDATFTVDGVAKTSTTNKVTDAVPGVTLALTRTTTSPATVTFSSDALVHTNLSNFISAYNDVVSAGHAAAGFGSQAAAAPEIANDTAITSSLDQVSSVIDSSVSGPSTYTTLASIGVQKDASTGLLSLDSTILSNALASSPSDVQRLLVGNDSTGDKGAMATLHDTITGLISGSSSTLQARTDALVAQSSDLATQETDAQNRISSYSTVLHDLLTSLASQMSSS